MVKALDLRSNGTNVLVGSNPTPGSVILQPYKTYLIKIDFYNEFGNYSIKSQ